MGATLWIRTSRHPKGDRSRAIHFLFKEKAPPRARRHYCKFSKGEQVTTWRWTAYLLGGPKLHGATRLLLGKWPLSPSPWPCISAPILSCQLPRTGSLLSSLTLVQVRKTSLYFGADGQTGSGWEGRQVAQAVRNLPTVQEIWVWSLSQEEPLEQGVATHSRFLPGKSHGQRSLAGHSPGGCRVRHAWATNTCFILGDA